MTHASAEQTFECQFSKKMLDVMQNKFALIYRANGDFYYILHTLNVLSRIWYAEKIIEKTPDVPMTKTYRSSHLTWTFVP